MSEQKAGALWQNAGLLGGFCFSLPAVYFQAGVWAHNGEIPFFKWNQNLEFYVKASNL